MPSPGFGAEWGQNFGGGGVVYLTNLSPPADSLVPPSNTISFTIGVQGSLIDLSTVQISINAQQVFSGFTALFNGINEIEIVGVSNLAGLFEIQTNFDHGLSTGQGVTIQGAVGSPINGGWIVTFVDTTHFTLQDSTFSGTWTSGGILSLPPAFTIPFVLSSYSYDAPNNGYTFIIQSGIEYPSVFTVEVVVDTTDGGTSTQTYQLFSTIPVVYPPMPYGVPLGNIPLDSFSGEAKAGLLASGQGQVFFSPALPTANIGSQIDVDSLETVVQAFDVYNPDPTVSTNCRPWLWGPPKGLKITNVTNNGGQFEITTSDPITFISGTTVNIMGISSTGGIPASINAVWTVTITGINTFTLDGSVFVGAYSGGGIAIPLELSLDRPFPPTFDPANYLPVWNSWVVPNQAPFVYLKTTQATATGILTDIPTGNKTVILY